MAGSVAYAIGWVAQGLRKDKHLEILPRVLSSVDISAGC
jgi:hypothetical protein